MYPAPKPSFFSLATKVVQFTHLSTSVRFLFVRKLLFFSFLSFLILIFRVKSYLCVFDFIALCVKYNALFSWMPFHFVYALMQILRKFDQSKSERRVNQKVWSCNYSRLFRGNHKTHADFIVSLIECSNHNLMRVVWKIGSRLQQTYYWLTAKCFDAHAICPTFRHEIPSIRFCSLGT